ncbi:MAG: DNA repair protein RadC [Bacteroidaceae bacterium]|nr:DNA repair protein RadC [Bacteroidaceae bacterium]MBQ3957659.1 DNA repair protein RadC [Bacteroidaceae bacterium]MBQ3992599.1 DNA repair protein RadC [Bacteroidaceae bacterium]
MNINEWAEQDRPREKLIARGAAALTDAELLAILIGSGSSGESAVELMRRILADCDGRLKRLGRLKLEDLTAYKGMGPAKAVTLMAACELGRRRESEPQEEKVHILRSTDVAAYFRPILQDLPYEECHLMLLKQDLSLLETSMLSRGGIAGSAVDVRLILQRALLKGAPVLALCHNHPSGNLRPSTQDRQLTAALASACKVMGIRLLDHVIVSDRGFYSFSDEGAI